MSATEKGLCCMELAVREGSVAAEYSFGVLFVKLFADQRKKCDELIPSICFPILTWMLVAVSF